ncbi:MAG: hypothetical protein INQ03_08450 [Candidatus Heimdallarchaeota archaeon]|nr:hypothetical protein [Candidatus Heimdallarchaeota archaeon]
MKYSILLIFLLLPIGFVQGATQSRDITSGSFTDDANDVFKVNPFTAPDDHTPATADFLDIVGFEYTATEVNTSATTLKITTTFTDTPVLNDSINIFLQFSYMPKDRSVFHEIQYNFNFRGNTGVEATRQIFYANTSQEMISFTPSNGTGTNSLWIEATFATPKGYNFSTAVDGWYHLRVDAIFDLDLNADSFELWDLAIHDFEIGEEDSNNQGTTLDADISAVYQDPSADEFQVNPYTAPDDHTDADAPFLDITTFGFASKKINNTAGILRMNATFTDSPVFNQSIRYFFQFSIQPEDKNVYQEVQYNFDVFGDYAQASRQIFYANQNQEMLNFEPEGGLVGKTLFVQAEFPVPSGISLTDFVEGDYMVRVDVTFDMDINADTTEIWDLARFDFSVDASGNVIAGSDTQSASDAFSLPAPIFGLASLLMIPVIRKKFKQ